MYGAVFDAANDHRLDPALERRFADFTAQLVTDRAPLRTNHILALIIARVLRLMSCLIVHLISRLPQARVKLITALITIRFAVHRRRVDHS